MRLMLASRSNRVGPFHVDVDFHLIRGLAGADRRNIGDREIGRGQMGQAELGGEYIGVVLNRQRTAPVDDRVGLRADGK
jgi:hypothetical protein